MSMHKSPLQHTEPRSRKAVLILIYGLPLFVEPLQQKNTT